ncbi:MAG: hypothetical protein U5L45_20960 [Saprospiraceae bacterium]|nr:hypothetical protein [Saprospiraceae bacterium]
MTFEEIRNKLFSELPSKTQRVEAYLVSNVFVRFNLFIVGDNERLINSLKVEYSECLESIQTIRNGDLIHTKLQEGRSLIDENLYFIDRHVDKINQLVYQSIAL